jgi:hypothetical protein
VEETSPKTFATFVIFKKLTEVNNPSGHPATNINIFDIKSMSFGGLKGDQAKPAIKFHF